MAFAIPQSLSYQSGAPCEKTEENPDARDIKAEVHLRKSGIA
jgi:hypothetical protein